MRLPSLVVLVSSALAVAANPVVIDGPVEVEPPPSRCAPAIQCTAKLAKSETLSVEAGSDGRSGDGELVHGGQMVVRYFLSPRIELDLYTNTLILAGADPRSHEGFQPGVKVSLIDEGDFLPAHAVQAYLTLPTFAASQTLNFEAWWTVSKTVGVFHADLNFMFAMSDVLGEQPTQGLAMLTLATDCGHGVMVFGEAYGTWGQTQARPPGMGLFSGVSMAATDELVLDVGAEVALHEATMPMVTVFAGVTWVPDGGQKPMPVAPVLARR
ncbi:MAG TPA: hypothetical protein VGD87_00160 [Archangium sp.]